MSLDLTGKRALVTGGGTGAGAAMARALAAAGAEVVICGRRKAPLEVVAAPHAAITAAVCDVTDEAGVAALFEDHGPFDVVVANAGIADSAPLDRTEVGALERLMQVNVTGTFLTLREAARSMKAAGLSQGRIVAVASTAALKGYAYAGAYAASKHAVLGLVRSAALELAVKGITVNALCPGFMDTEMTAQSVANITARTGRNAHEARAALAASNPMNRLVQPGDVAEALLWLCAPGAAMVTGQAIALAGGEI
ncbi:SDR family NAD(P)-dependent oxidoreductase [Novosphingobium profundi]|uniref:SDR family NAD(P)-dependent oxidoreductase n=1 Tax=Novosphingobium profundi TaxID=1774954 RepID=UPI0031BBCDA8